MVKLSYSYPAHTASLCLIQALQAARNRNPQHRNKPRILVQWFWACFPALYGYKDGLIAELWQRTGAMYYHLKDERLEYVQFMTPIYINPCISVWLNWLTALNLSLQCICTSCITTAMFWKNLSTFSSHSSLTGKADKRKHWEAACTGASVWFWAQLWKALGKHPILNPCTTATLAEEPQEELWLRHEWPPHRSWLTGLCWRYRLAGNY